jgi:acyl-CoA synthetase (AMP-forming)/AMP-acid ligase II
MRLFDFFDKQADARPDAVAVMFNGAASTYRDIQEQSRKVAQSLMAAGLPEGAKVASWIRNHPVFFSIQIGIHRTPYVWLPLNPRATAQECASNMEAFGAEWLFIEACFADHIRLIRSSVPTLLGTVALNGEVDGCLSFEDFCNGSEPRPAEVNIRPEDVVTLITTGGSTGKPKGVLRTSMNWAALIVNYRLKLFQGEPPTNLVATPLTHVAGEVAQAVFAEGGMNVILEKPDPVTILEAIERYAITSLFVPPTLLYMMLARNVPGKHRFGSLKYLMYGAAPISLDKLREAWKVFGPVMTQLYGLMEATSTVSIMSPMEHAATLDGPAFGGVGRGSPLVMIDVFDENGRPAAAGTKGEVVCRGTNLCSGYEANPEATAEAFRHGWFHTGDIGYRDKDGFFHLVDRRKDIIITGGFNIYPGEVEQVLWTHPAVQDCAVIGVPHDKWGEAVTAIVELKPGASVMESDLIALCKEQLGSVKAPKTVEIWPALPRSVVGKVLKKEIRAHYWKNLNRNI